MSPEPNKSFNSAHVDVIAERILIGVTDKETFEVRVRFQKPLPHPKGDWACSYEITGIGNQFAREICGIDAVQALQLAMCMAGADLARIQSSVKLQFLDSDDLGFPKSTKEATGSCPYCATGDSKC